MYHVEKIVAPLLFPVPLCLWVLILGLLMLWFTGRQRTGKALVSAGTAMLLLLSYPPVSGSLLEGLEYSFHPLGDGKENVRWIEVLGGGGFCDLDLPLANRVPPAGLYRVFEAVRLHKENPGSKLIFTGRKGAPKNAEIAAAAGVSRDSIIVEIQPRNTEEEARAVKKIVNTDRFILVTSASHMRRSMALFEKEGMRPIPAPAEYLVQKEHCPEPYPSVPCIDGLRQSTTAFYEYLALAWLKLRGQI